MSSLKKTPLTDEHIRLGAKMVPFAGYEMPIMYPQASGGMKKEHQLVRNEAGIFDVSHMGEFWVRGPQAADFLSHVCTRPMNKLSAGKARYCMLLDKAGHILDDIIVYRVDESSFWLVVNADNTSKDFKHLSQIATEFDINLEDVSEETALIAIQGPRAKEIVDQFARGASELGYYEFLQQGAWLIARTGYTGEDGFEVFLPASEAQDLWKRLLDLGIKPIGLGARDTLRLEVGFALYGHELTEDLLPQETLSSFALRKEGAYLGSEGAKKPPRYRPLALVGKNAKPMREGEKILFDDKEVGWVTSGSTSPILGKGIGLGLVEAAAPQEAKIFLLDRGGNRREAELASTPFVETERVKKRQPV